MIVGITGRAGAGKDTFAEFLRLNGNVATSSFAYTLKVMISTMLGVDYQQWEDREWKEKEIPGVGYSPRYLAQTLGTEWGRECLDKDIWVRLAMNRADEVLKALGPGWHCAFTDCRFENEADAIASRGGYIIHVERPGDDSATESQHVSEAGIEVNSLRGDIVIMNDGTLDDLEAKAISTYKDMLLHMCLMEETRAAL